ncbi:MAG: electron transfer flavoprotein subunit alpha/FixB family protein [Verrucomicrobiae bacterium]|nr:electron transfer flavoprotein subunit alpha/FixB family protein [Verrucomicrobiae bacterium]
MTRSLILIEHDGRQPRAASLHAVSLARALGGEYALLVLGSQITDVAAALRSYGASRILTADHPALQEPLADRYAAVVAQAASSWTTTHLLGTTSTFSKDVLPRVAALLDAPMLTDVMAFESRDDGPVFHRPLSAGSQRATVRVTGDRLVLTARGTAFPIPTPDPSASPSPVEPLPVDAGSLPSGTRFVSRSQPASGRPDLTEARVVVSGGRPLGDAAAFDRLIGGLADALGGAVGATRGAVDGGMAPNDWQVGQTGKVVAPELYFAIGISGAIQHVAGMQDSRVIVAINRDPEAPIFQVATYGLVGDLHQIVPDLLARLGPR